MFPSSALSKQHLSLLGRGSEVEHVCVNEMQRFQQNELKPCVLIQSDETGVLF